MRNLLVFLFLSLLSQTKLYAQCATDPTAIDSSRCGPGTVSLNATGSKTLFNWYDASSSGNFIGSGQSITSPSINATDSFFVAEYDTSKNTNGLLFDGTNDYIAIDSFFYSGTGYTEMTVEAWVRTSSAGDHIIASYDRSDFWRFEINGDAATAGRIGLGIRTDAGLIDFGGTIAINDNSWHHVAAVFDNGDIYLYVDGALDTSTTSGTTFGLASTRYGYIGTGSEATSFNSSNSPTDYFDGEMREFRIWNIARTQAEIQASMNFCLTGGETGLEVYIQLSDTGSSTLATDLTRKGYDGFLQNFSLPAARITNANPLFSCIICESARDTLIATVKYVPSIELGSDTCVSDSIILDAGANYSSYLWNTGATTRTLFVDSSGFYSVEIDTSGSDCKFSDGLSISVLKTPSGQDTSRCGPGSILLTASGSTGSYYWYDKNDSLVGSGVNYTTPFLSQSDTFFLAAFENDSSDQALSFDGTDDYVALNMSYTDPGEIPVLTVEAWVRTSETGTGSTSNWAIVDFDRSEYFNFYVRGDNGLLSFATTDNSNTVDDFDAPAGTAINDGQWHHVAAVYDGTDKILYIDGTQVATKVNPHGGRALGTGNDRFGFLGDGSESGTFNSTRNNLYFDGDLDEIRIWSVQRNLALLQAFKDECLSGAESGLEAYYKMENGTGSSSLTDHSNNGRTGTLVNMNTTSAWLNSGPAIFCSCGESEKDSVFATINKLPTISLGNDTCVNDSLVLDAGPNFSSYTWQDASSNRTFTATESRAFYVEIDSTGLPCSNSDTIIVSVGIAAEPQLIDSSRCGNGVVSLIASGVGQIRWFDQDTGGALLAVGDTFNVGPITSDSVFYVSSLLGSSSALDFDGSNDYVAIANKSYASNTLGEMTVECWINTTDGTDQVIASYDRNEYWRLEVNGAGAGTGQIGFDILTNSGQLDFGGTTRIDDGDWHHVAAVYDSGAVRIYIDGSLDANTTRGTRFGSGNTRFGFLGVGSEAPSFNGSRGPNSFFDGLMDEFRLWNVARTQAEIQSTIDSCLNGNETGLELYYRMSASSGTTLEDFAASNTGTIVGAAWDNNGQVFNCSSCSESARIPITATINPTIDSATATVSCPGSTGTIVYLDSYGGSGTADYRELSGIFNYSGSFDSSVTKKLLPNGGVFKVEIKDENNCLDTITSISTSAQPVSVLRNSFTSSSCRVPDENNFFYVTGASNEIIMAINPNGEDLGEITAEVSVSPDARVFNNNAYLGRSFNVDVENQPSSNVDLRFYFSAAEYSDLVDSSLSSNNISEDDVNSLSDLGATKYDGPAEDSVYNPATATNLNFISQSSSGTEFGNNYIQIPTSSFSEFWIHASESGSPLSLALSGFSSSVIDNQVYLYWKQNNPQFLHLPFSVQRIDNQTDLFEEIAILYPNGQTEFSMIDSEAKEGFNYYRLMQIDENGVEHYSYIIDAFVESSDKEFLEWILFPQPANNKVYLKTVSSTSKDLRIRISIMDLLGKVHLSKESSFHEIESIDLSDYMEGMYLINISEGAQSTTLPLIIRR